MIMNKRLEVSGNEMKQNLCDILSPRANSRKTLFSEKINNNNNKLVDIVDIDVLMCTEPLLCYYYFFY